MPPAKVCTTQRQARSAMLAAIRSPVTLPKALADRAAISMATATLPDLAAATTATTAIRTSTSIARRFRPPHEQHGDTEPYRPRRCLTAMRTLPVVDRHGSPIERVLRVADAVCL